MKTSVAAKVRSRVSRLPISSFIQPSLIDGPPGAIDAEFSRLSREGRLLRVRKGLYWKGRVTKIGMVPPDPEVVAIAVGGAGSGPAGVAAVHRLGLTTQVPGYPRIAVPGKTPSAVPGVRFSERPWSRREFRLSEEEVAVIEVLRDWPQAVEGSWNDLLDSVIRLHAEDAIRPRAISKDVEREHHRGLRERWALLSEEAEFV
jgi:hypothetical protein